MTPDLQNKIDEAEASLASQMEYINGMKDDRALSNYPSLPVHSYLWAFSEGAKFGRNDKQIQSLKDENKKFREALEFYANGGNPNRDIWFDEKLGYFTGKRARQTLDGVSK